VGNDGFEGFALGDPLGQNGWGALDVPVYNASNFDIDIVDPSATWGAELGTRALRISNAVTSFGFGNQLQSASLSDEAGESSAEEAPSSGGVRQSRLSGTISFASATQAYQPGLVFSFAPDSGDGTRMASFRISDEPSGLRVEVATLDESIPNFVYTTVASGLSHTELHTLDFSLDLVDSVNNDVLWVRVGDDGCSTFTESGSWEQYHRFYAGNPTPIVHPVDSILFRVSGTAVPANLGGGILFDTFDLETSTVPAVVPGGVPVVATVPAASATGQRVDVSATAATVNPCEPVTQYAVTLTPLGGGAPITLAAATTDFDFDGVPPGTYAVTYTATNASGTSVASPSASVTVAAAGEASPDPEPTDNEIVDEDGDGNPDGELALTGPTLLPLGLAALALVALGFVVRRRAY
jgi:hypothetical protein